MIKIDFFRPILFAAKPKTIVPKIPPTVKIDPMIEASLLLIGPDLSGVLDDFRSGIAALAQPVPKPYAKHKRFAQKVA